MKAIVVNEIGDPASVLKYQDVEDPVVGPGQVLIDVVAAGCNFPDILIVQGKYQVKPRLPFSPGHEVAGTIAAVGEGVTDFRPGQRVVALMGFGGYAERAVVSRRDVFPLPDSVSFEVGAAVGVVYQTGLCALERRAQLRAGETLLVHGAAGGVGLAAVQLGKALGARVIATAGSPRKVELARAHGADVAIDYSREDMIARVKEETGGRGADVIYDPVGGDVFDASTRCVAFEGRILVIGFAGGRIADVATNRILVKNFAVVGVHWGMYRDLAPALVDGWMARIFAMVGSGKLRPLVSARHPLREATTALAALASREAVGKIVLVP